jgi:ribosome-binding factor A
MKSHRPERVATVVRHVVSDAIANRLSDPRIAPLSSVTRVEVSGDLEHARVFVSVMGEEATQRRTLAGLKSAVGAVQRMLARELSIRQCPRLSFHLDLSIKRATETIRLINETMAEHQAAPSVDEPEEDEPAPDQSPGDDA